MAATALQFAVSWQCKKMQKYNGQTAMRILLIEDDTVLGSAVHDQIAADGHSLDCKPRAVQIIWRNGDVRLIPDEYASGMLVVVRSQFRPRPSNVQSP